MFVSVLVILYPEAPTGLGLTDLDRRCRDFEDSSAVTSHLPSCVPLFVSADKGEESQSVHFLPGQILKVLCVCHIRKGLIDLLVPIVPR